ncbi:MAG: hypothetical protein K2K67_08635, partial [Treponemataceae bacterium]|nr:hypothetical protein [Treponemataceae bacterium]
MVTEGRRRKRRFSRYILIEIVCKFLRAFSDCIEQREHMAHLVEFQIRIPDRGDNDVGAYFLFRTGVYVLAELIHS